MVRDGAWLQQACCRECLQLLGEKEKSKVKPPIWWLKGLEIAVRGADVYDEVRDVAFGDSPEELLVWAKINGLDIAKGQEL